LIFSLFYVENEENNYRLQVSGYNDLSTGNNAFSLLINAHPEQQFSTTDSDNGGSM